MLLCLSFDREHWGGNVHTKAPSRMVSVATGGNHGLGWPSLACHWDQLGERRGRGWVQWHPERARGHPSRDWRARWPSDHVSLRNLERSTRFPLLPPALSQGQGTDTAPTLAEPQQIIVTYPVCARRPRPQGCRHTCRVLYLGSSQSTGSLVGAVGSGGRGSWLGFGRAPSSAFSLQRGAIPPGPHWEVGG